MANAVELLDRQTSQSLNDSMATYYTTKQNIVFVAQELVENLAYLANTDVQTRKTNIIRNSLFRNRAKINTTVPPVAPSAPPAETPRATEIKSNTESLLNLFDEAPATAAGTPVTPVAPPPVIEAKPPEPAFVPPPPPPPPPPAASGFSELDSFFAEPAMASAAIAQPPAPPVEEKVVKPIPPLPPIEEPVSETNDLLNLFDEFAAATPTTTPVAEVKPPEPAFVPPPPAPVAEVIAPPPPPPPAPAPSAFSGFGELDSFFAEPAPVAPPPPAPIPEVIAPPPPPPPVAEIITPPPPPAPSAFSGFGELDSFFTEPAPVAPPPPPAEVKPPEPVFAPPPPPAPVAEVMAPPPVIETVVSQPVVEVTPPEPIIETKPFESAPQVSYETAATPAHDIDDLKSKLSTTDNTSVAMSSSIRDNLSAILMEIESNLSNMKTYNTSKQSLVSLYDKLKHNQNMSMQEIVELSRQIVEANKFVEEYQTKAKDELDSMENVAELFKEMADALVYNIRKAKNDFNRGN